MDFTKHYLNDKRYQEVDRDLLKSTIERLQNKYCMLSEDDRTFLIEARLDSLFGPKGPEFKPLPLGIQEKFEKYSL